MAGRGRLLLGQNFVQDKVELNTPPVVGRVIEWPLPRTEYRSYPSDDLQTSPSTSNDPEPYQRHRLRPLLLTTRKHGAFSGRLQRAFLKLNTTVLYFRLSTIHQTTTVNLPRFRFRKIGPDMSWQWSPP
jgi:hypothetical protein